MYGKKKPFFLLFFFPFIQPTNTRIHTNLYREKLKLESNEWRALLRLHVHLGRGCMEMLVKYIILAWQCNSLICLAPPGVLSPTHTVCSYTYSHTHIIPYIDELEGVDRRRRRLEGRKRERGPIEDLQTCCTVTLSSLFINNMFSS